MLYEPSSPTAACHILPAGLISKPLPLTPYRGALPALGDGGAAAAAAAGTNPVAAAAIAAAGGGSAAVGGAGRHHHLPAPPIWDQALELEKRLRAELRKKSFWDHDVRRLRGALQGTYEALLFGHYEFSCAHEVEPNLWKAVFYKPIEEFRSRTRALEALAKGTAAAATAAAPAATTTISPNGAGVSPPAPAAAAVQLATPEEARAQLARTTGAYLRFLDDALAFYRKTVWKLQWVHGSVGAVVDLDAALQNEIQECVPRATGPRAPEVRQSVHRCLIYLGDLCRYQSMALKERPTSARPLWERAMSYYRQAARVLPGSGNPYNQMAVMSYYTNDELRAVYYYFRSLAVAMPFATARENLMLLFEKNRNRYGSIAASHAAAALQGGHEGGDSRAAAGHVADVSVRFVRLHGMLFDKINLHQFPEVLAAAMHDLEALLGHPGCRTILQKAPEADQLLFHLAIMNIFSVHNVTTGGGVTGGGDTSASYAAAAKRAELLCYALAVAMRFAAAVTAVTASMAGAAAAAGGVGDVDTGFGAVSTACHVMLAWMVSNPEVLSPKPPGMAGAAAAAAVAAGGGGSEAPPEVVAEVTARSSFLVAAARLASHLSDLTRRRAHDQDWQDPAVRHRSLPEDSELVGFGPLMPVVTVAATWPAASEASGGAAVLAVRVARMLQALRPPPHTRMGHRLLPRTAATKASITATRPDIRDTGMDMDTRQQHQHQQQQQQLSGSPHPSPPPPPLPRMLNGSGAAATAVAATTMASANNVARKAQQSGPGPGQPAATIQRHRTSNGDSPTAAAAAGATGGGSTGHGGGRAAAGRGGDDDVAEDEIVYQPPRPGSALPRPLSVGNGLHRRSSSGGGGGSSTAIGDGGGTALHSQDGRCLLSKQPSGSSAAPPSLIPSRDASRDGSSSLFLRSPSVLSTGDLANAGGAPAAAAPGAVAAAAAAAAATPWPPQGLLLNVGNLSGSGGGDGGRRSGSGLASPASGYGGGGGTLPPSPQDQQLQPTPSFLNPHPHAHPPVQQQLLLPHPTFQRSSQSAYHQEQPGWGDVFTSGGSGGGGGGGSGTGMAPAPATNTAAAAAGPPPAGSLARPTSPAVGELPGAGTIGLLQNLLHGGGGGGLASHSAAQMQSGRRISAGGSVTPGVPSVPSAGFAADTSNIAGGAGGGRPASSGSNAVRRLPSAASLGGPAGAALQRPASAAAAAPAVAAGPAAATTATPGLLPHPTQVLQLDHSPPPPLQQQQQLLLQQGHEPSLPSTLTTSTTGIPTVSAPFAGLPASLQQRAQQQQQQQHQYGFLGHGQGGVSGMLLLTAEGQPPPRPSAAAAAVGLGLGRGPGPGQGITGPLELPYDAFTQPQGAMHFGGVPGGNRSAGGGTTTSAAAAAATFSGLPVPLGAQHSPSGAVTTTAAQGQLCWPAGGGSGIGGGLDVSSYFNVAAGNYQAAALAEATAEATAVAIADELLQAMDEDELGAAGRNGGGGGNGGGFASPACRSSGSGSGAGFAGGSGAAAAAIAAAATGRARISCDGDGPATLGAWTGATTGLCEIQAPPLKNLEGFGSWGVVPAALPERLGEYHQRLRCSSGVEARSPPLVGQAPGPPWEQHATAVGAAAAAAGGVGARQVSLPGAVQFLQHVSPHQQATTAAIPTPRPIPPITKRPTSYTSIAPPIRISLPSTSTSAVALSTTRQHHYPTRPPTPLLIRAT
ncbi:hypothetical protein VOLCADRAFT_92921 [Volvox carteri f. nagariensis]|uniref:Telomerase activating protein Est1-like N-terminal domain-containing protein n=1 Tax=Volvox carteri f. nagariensis TaxID=3068 RepID=D8U0T7_VOLCA|nr:uncharacterized protein VOLCADRAFT_92921 [Volvox carteri f. nagariensis]EFJ46697.1 hypothetical protein VOLCADRAFT_92921 [Volvox carteri f. nagariensis]|eukprot:XP_002952226.1 hypothetical protein VOLCADRAFT_92921 [Volvox carteri f. nagariensis]